MAGAGALAVLVLSFVAGLGWEKEEKVYDCVLINGYCRFKCSWVCSNYSAIINGMFLEEHDCMVTQLMSKYSLLLSRQWLG